MINYYANFNLKKEDYKYQNKVDIINYLENKESSFLQMFWYREYKPHFGTGYNYFF